MGDMRHWEHWRCADCGTFDGPHDGGYCDVCHDQGRDDAMVEQYVPAEQLQGAVEALKQIAQNDSMDGLIAANALTDLGISDPLVDRILGGR
jgi:hypothetical protein